MRVADEAQGSRVALHGIVVVVAVHVANGFGNVVAVIADGDLGRVSAALLVDALQLAGSIRRLRCGDDRLAFACPLRVAGEGSGGERLRATKARHGTATAPLALRGLERRLLTCILAAA